MRTTSSPRRRLPIASRAAWWRLGALGLVIAACGFAGWWWCVRQPGVSFRGGLPAMSDDARGLAGRLRADLTVLAVEIGERNLIRRPTQLERAATFIESAFTDAGLAVERQEYRVGRDQCRNLIAEIAGGARRDEIVVVGAHYDSVLEAPGANDNGTGVVALLALARAFAHAAPARTLRLVAFVNEEPPYFQTDDMGSLVYAKRCQARGERVVEMLSLETIGCYSDVPGSQHFPSPALAALYPSTGDFAAFVGESRSRALVNDWVGGFRRLASFPCEGAALPGAVPGADWSDHWSFARCGYPAIMLTDTAPFRYAHYHQPTDTIDKVDIERLARVVEGVVAVLRERLDG